MLVPVAGGTVCGDQKKGRRSKVRILQIHNSYKETGGEDLAAETERRLLSDAGHVVQTVGATNDVGRARSAVRLSGAAWNPRAHREVRRAVQELDPHVVHVHNTWFSLSPSVIHGACSTGTPVVVTLHNFRYVCSQGSFVRNDAQCIECINRKTIPAIKYGCYRDSRALTVAAALAAESLRRTLRARETAIRLLALSEDARRMAISAGLPPERLDVKPHSVDDPGPRGSPPSESGLMLYVGRLSKEKGVPSLLRAWSEVSRDGLRLALIGDGPLRSELESLKLANVEVLGPQPRSTVQRFMFESRALLMPSLAQETFGLVALEAMASGLPVFASEVGALPELCRGQRLLPPGDSKAWRDAIEALESPEADEMGRSGRGRFISEYSHDTALRKLEQIYSECRL